MTNPRSRKPRPEIVSDDEQAFLERVRTNLAQKLDRRHRQMFPNCPCCVGVPPLEYVPLSAADRLRIDVEEAKEEAREARKRQNQRRTKG